MTGGGGVMLRIMQIKKLSAYYLQKLYSKKHQSPKRFLTLQNLRNETT